MRSCRQWITVEELCRQCLVVCLLIACQVAFVEGGCRIQEDKCAPVCVHNPQTQAMDCNLRAVLIFTNSTEFEASLQKMEVVWDLALQRIHTMGLLPDNLNIVGKFYDDHCDQSRAIISAMDGHFKDCADVLFGPVCDYALASVARFAKYLHSEGTPVLTPGGNSFEYLQPKLSCENEFYMLIRTGFLNYQPLALFTVELFKRYNWKKVVYLYDRDGQYSVGGQLTCHLTMSTLAKFHKENNISYSAYSASFENLTETLQREVGYDKTSE